MPIRWKMVLCRIFLGWFLVSGILGGNAFAAAEDMDGRFSEHEYRGHLEFLAGDLLEGRATADRGAALAAAYLAAQFKTLGLQPYSSEHGYLQPIQLKGFRTDYETVRFALSGSEGECRIEPLAEFCVTSEVMVEEVSADDELLFVGYAIEAPEYKWDDFKGQSVEGKIIVALVDDPDFKATRFGGESMTYYGRWTYKLEMARRKKAKGIILVHHEREATYDWSIVRNSWLGERFTFADQKDAPLQIYSWIAHGALERALQGTGLDYVTLKKKADNRRFKPMVLPLRLNVSFRQKARQAECHNVIGVIPGSDPLLKDEIVLYTGHFDHFGIGLPDETGDRIYNGALDNASGTAALVCLARAFAQSPVKPKRSVAIMPVTGEEMGLLGSTWFVEHPPFDLKKIAMVINKDCMNHFGRCDSFSAFPIEYSNALADVQELALSKGLTLRTRSVDKSGGAFRSDHFPFAARGVPAMSVGMGGKFLDRSEDEIREVRRKIGFTYHQASDNVHPLWVYDGVLQELDLLYALGRHWADGAAKPTLAIDRNNPFWATQVWYGLAP